MMIIYENDALLGFLKMIQASPNSTGTNSSIATFNNFYVGLTCSGVTCV